MSTTRRARANAVFEMEIPSASDDESFECPICYQGFCTEETCCRTQTNLVCCDSPICCYCLLKLAKRCTCNDDCSQVIVICSYCRELASVTALDMYLGTKQVCEMCLEDEEEEGKGDITAGVSDTETRDPDWHPTNATET